jgi:hypothetical protein
MLKLAICCTITGEALNRFISSRWTRSKSRFLTRSTLSLYAYQNEDKSASTIWKWLIRHCYETTNWTITTTKVVGLNYYALASPLRSLAKRRDGTSTYTNTYTMSKYLNFKLSMIFSFETFKRTHLNVLSMKHFQTVNDILIWDRIRIWTNQIQNMLVTAFNRLRKPMSRSVLLRRQIYSWINIFSIQARLFA